jgi:hypothetical protein
MTPCVILAYDAVLVYAARALNHAVVLAAE